MWRFGSVGDKRDGAVGDKTDGTGGAAPRMQEKEDPSENWSSVSWMKYEIPSQGRFPEAGRSGRLPGRPGLTVDELFWWGQHLRSSRSRSVISRRRARALSVGPGSGLADSGSASTWLCAPQQCFQRHLLISHTNSITEHQLRSMKQETRL